MFNPAIAYREIIIHRQAISSQLLLFKFTQMFYVLKTNLEITYIAYNMGSFPPKGTERMYFFKISFFFLLIF